MIESMENDLVVMKDQHQREAREVQDHAQSLENELAAIKIEIREMHHHMHRIMKNTNV